MSSAEIIQLGASPLDRMITVTVFNDRFACTKRESVIRARRLPSAMQRREAPSKHALPLLKLASFGEQVTAKGCYRTNSNTLSIDGIEGDYDGGKVSVDEAVERLRAANLAGIVYTSPSHTAEKPRWRVLAFTSTTLPAEARSGLVARLNGALGGILHPESFTLSQPFYFGHVAGAAYRCETVEGRAIDEAQELPALGPAGKPHRPPGAAAGNPQAPIDDVIVALAIIPNAERNWNRWINVGMAIWRATAGSEEGRDAFHNWSEKYEGYDAAYTDDRWEHFSSSPPEWIGFPALERAAREVDPRWRPPSLKRAVDQTFKPIQAKAGPLALIDPSRYQGVAIPERRWLVPEWIPMARATGLYGGGGEGKTLLAQTLATACALGQPWLGLPVTQCRSLLLFCEDDLDEMLQRQAAINRHFGCDFADLGAMRWEPRLGHDNTLMTFTGGRPERTPLFDQVLAEAKAFGAKLVITDTVADVFAGNENDRTQVRAFVQQTLAYMAREIDGAVVALAHPSRAGIRDGSGESGSTAWQGTLRSRLYLSTPQGDDGPIDPDLRVLAKMKINASRRDAIELRWRNGVLVPTMPPIEASGSVERRTCESVFLSLLDKAKAEGQHVSHKLNAGNYAPRLFARRPDAERFTKRQFEVAMQALFSRGLIEVGVRKDVRGRPIECLTRLDVDSYMDSTVTPRFS